MAQNGSLYRSHGSWFLKYWEKMRTSEGTVKRVQRTHRLASTADFPKKNEVKALQVEHMARVNRAGFSPDAGVRLVDFAENSWFPAIERRLSPSTVNGYRKAWRCHLKHRVESFRVRDFRAVDGQKLMDSLGDEHGTKLSHQSFQWLKVTMSAIFTHARREGVIDNVNPMQDVLIPRGKRHGRKALAFSLEEVIRHLELFNTDSALEITDEDGIVYRPGIKAKTVKTIIGVAAFAALRMGEIRGLWWEDDDGEVLNIRRSVWRSHIKDTKTGEHEDDPGVVPIIEPLRAMLDALRPENAFGFMFANRLGGALDLENLADRVIKPVLKANGLVWKGWHGYRRGLATNLSMLGIPDMVIQAILRHENVSTTQRYIKRVPTEATNAMNLFAAEIAGSAVVPQSKQNAMVN